MLGIFWLYQNQIYCKLIAMESIEPINGFIDSDFAHYQVWDEMVGQHKDFYLYEYEDIPRGRVVYDIDNAQYIVYANQDIIDSKKANGLIMDAFDIKTKKVIFKYDEHYRL
ncbi:MAG: hypothetical protein U9N49_11575 [Campylobacterota bacterium]|nr:hypothetical protein [Campylobacterota bacterium]